MTGRVKPDPLRSFFRRQGSLHRFSRGDIIVTSNQESPDLYYIVSGLVKVHSVNDRGDEYIHLLYKPEELFPVTLMFSSKSQNASYSAATDCSLLMVTHKQLHAELEHDLLLTRALLEQTVAQFRIYADRVDNLQYKFSRERLIYRLLFLAARFGQKQSDGSYIIQAPITQQSIANSINLSRESVSREFERLRTKNLICYQGHSITVLDWRELSKEFKRAPSGDWWGLS